MTTFRKPYQFSISQRWVFTILACSGLCIGSILRGIISITIIEMAEPTEKSVEHIGAALENFDKTFPNRNRSLNFFDSEIIASKRNYGWDEYTQGIILSSFFWSYSLAQCFYGPLAERFGGKYLLGLGIFLPAVITFLTPFVTDWGGSTALIVTRVLMGAANGAMYPVSSTMVSKWTTPTERTKIGNAIYAGPLLGLFIGTIMPALIMKYSSLGWPAVFYSFGGVGILWFPAWVLLVYNSPEEHPFISEEELEYLQNSSGVKGFKNKLPPAPWKHILMCKEFWVFTVSLIGHSWAYYAMVSDLPKYMSSVVKFSIENNGYVSSLPYFFMWLNTITSTWINDKLLKKKWMSLTNVRKLLTTIGLSGPGIFLLLASYAGFNKILVVTMFMIGITLMGCLYPSVMMNALDLSPNYAGSVMAVGNSISATVGIITPYVVGILAPNQTIGEWRLVFWIVFSFSVASNVIYLLWFNAEVKEWDDPNFVRNKAKASENATNSGNN